MQSDGYSLDDKRSKIEASDLPDIVAKWNNRKNLSGDDRNGKFFAVPRAEIEKNDYDLSINRYKETIYEKVEYEKPEVILGKISVLEEEIVAALRALK